MRASLLEQVLCGQRVLADDDFGIGAQRLHKTNEITDSVLIHQLLTASVTISQWNRLRPTRNDSVETVDGEATGIIARAAQRRIVLGRLQRREYRNSQ